MSNWNLLSEAQKRVFAKNLVMRRKAYEFWLKTGRVPEGKRILIVGDRPGPKAPQVSDFHHTPFYAKVYSGGWLNSALVEANIDESILFWVNSASFDGVPTDTKILFGDWDDIHCLGKNAEKWASKAGAKDFHSWDHPQFHKRFKSKEAYPFVQHLASKAQVAALAG